MKLVKPGSEFQLCALFFEERVHKPPNRQPTLLLSREGFGLQQMYFRELEVTPFMFVPRNAFQSVPERQKRRKFSCPPQLWCASTGICAAVVQRHKDIKGEVAEATRKVYSLMTHPLVAHSNVPACSGAGPACRSCPGFIFNFDVFIFVKGFCPT
mgnify:CR=1 FL=1